MQLVESERDMCLTTVPVIIADGCQSSPDGLIEARPRSIVGVKRK